MPRIKKYGDPVLFVTIALLVVVGIFMVASSSWTAGLSEKGDGTYFLKRHLIFLMFGVGAAFAGYVIPLRILRKLAFPMWILSLILCLALFTPLGVSVKGATRWLAIPGTSFQFMPSDILKYTSIFYVAHLATVHRSGKKRSGFIPILGVIGISILLVMKEDFSTASVIAVSLLGMFFASGISIGEIVTILGLGIATGYGFLLRVPYRMKRLSSFIDPFDDIGNTDWQLANSLFSIGIGSLTGVGYFNFHQTYSRLPEAYNDFIFAVIGQELGLIGSVFVIALFIILIFRGFNIAIMQEELYEKLVATGIFLSIGFQAFFNMGVSTGILPVTGITLPYISYGGTALILVMGMSGVLLRLSAKGVSH